MSESKTQLLEHDGINGAILQSNSRRPPIKKAFTIQMINPSEDELNQFMALLVREKFWLESERLKTTKWWCYKIEATEAVEEASGLFIAKVTFICHPTKFFKSADTQTLTGNGVLRVQGSALAFPKITVIGQSASETSFTIGDQGIKLEKLSESLVMVNDPDNPSFKTATGSVS